MLENIRFEPGETKNDPELARRLAALADAYVNDAFGAAHRAHASTEGVAHLLPSAAGLLLQREVETLTGILEDPARPLVAIVGGAKVTDKIGVLEAFLERADAILIGGAMAFPFLSVQGHSIGDSLCADEDLEPARELLDARQRQAAPARRPRPRRGLRRRAPSAASSTASTCPTAGWASTSARAPPRPTREEIAGAGTVFWNGPMGAFELEPFAAGTRAVAEAVADAPGHDRRRRRRLVGGPAPVRPGRPRHPPLDRRRCVTRAHRGQDAPRSGGAVLDVPHAVHRRQLEDEQDDRRGGGLHPGPAPARLDRRRRRRRRLRPVHRPAGRRRLHARLARRGLRAEHAPGAARAPSPARSRRRCSPSSTSTASCSATPSAASTSTRPTGRCRRRSRPRSTPA